MATMNHLVPYLFLLSIPLSIVHTFTPLPPFLHQITPSSTTSTSSSSSSQLSMVFDFFQKRSQEGVEQIQKLSSSLTSGNFSQTISEIATYTSSTNRAFADGLARSRNRLLYDLEGWNGDILEELMDVLLRADIGMDISESVIEEVRGLREGSTEIIGKGEVRGILRGKLLESLDAGGNDMEGTDEVVNKAAIRFSEDPKVPTVLFVMGANGMGKTTTIGKLASRLSTEGSQRVLLAACDTFRAGAVEQLAMWATRSNVTCYGPTDSNKTPSSVLYGALDLALTGDEGGTYDTVIVDTSGRLSNNDALTEELVKMKRVIQKKLSVEEGVDGKKVANLDVPHETLLVIDAAQGRMALDSAKVWDEAMGGISGLVLTKLDGSAKGGSVVAVSRELGLPIKLIGVGEKIEDLRDFEAEQFVDSLLGIGSSAGYGEGGGGTSTSSSSASSAAKEKEAMEKRLAKLRKERDERNVVKSSNNDNVAMSTSSSSSGDTGNDVVDGMTLDLSGMDDDDVTPLTVPRVGGGGGGGGNKNKSKKKKKKKKKRR